MFSMWIIIMPENKDFFLSDIDALIYFLSLLYWVGASLVAQTVKNLPEMRETWVGKIPWRRERLPTPVFWPGEFHGHIVHGMQRVGHDWATSTFTFWAHIESLSLSLFLHLSPRAFCFFHEAIPWMLALFFILSFFHLTNSFFITQLKYYFPW